MDIRAFVSASLLVSTLIISPFFASQVSAKTLAFVPGKTKSQVSVLPNGTLDYSVPLELPLGSAGTAPKIRLNYNSGSGNGLLGRGWSISGMGVVTRCGTSTAIDGTPSGVEHNANDKFCLNGNRLILVSGQYGAAGSEYRTYVNSNQRVRIVGVANNSPTSFEVEAPDGRKFIYGATNDSRVELQNTSTPYLWALNRQIDLAGNYIDFEYYENNPSGEFHPKKISYTGNQSAQLAPYNHINFEYGPRKDPYFTCTAGSMTQTAVRLQEVEVTKSVPTGEDAEESKVFRRYVLSYEGGYGVTADSLPNDTCLTQSDSSAVAPPPYQLVLDERHNSDSFRLDQLKQIEQGATAPISKYTGGVNQQFRQLLSSLEVTTTDELDSELKSQLAIRNAYFKALYEDTTGTFNALDAQQRASYVADLESQLAALESDIANEGSSKQSDLETQLSILNSAKDLTELELATVLRAQIAEASRILLVPGRSKKKIALFDSLLSRLSIKHRASANAAIECLAESKDHQDNPLAQRDVGRACESESGVEAIEKFLHFSKGDELYRGLHESLNGDLEGNKLSLRTQVERSVGNQYNHLLVAGQIANAYEQFAELLLGETSGYWTREVASVESELNRFIADMQTSALTGLALNGEFLSEEQIKLEELNFRIGLLNSPEPEGFFNAHITKVTASFASLHTKFVEGEHQLIAVDDTQTRITQALQSLKITVRSGRVASHHNYQDLLDQLLNDGQDSILANQSKGSGATVLNETRLVSVMECGSDNSCLNPLKFNWTNENIGWQAPDSSSPTPDDLFSYGQVNSSQDGLNVDQGSSDGSDDTSTEQAGRPTLSAEQQRLGQNLAKAGQLVDVNNDGRNDWVLSYVDEAGVEFRGTWLNTDEGWTYSKEWELPAIISNYNLTPYGQFADVNRDGLIDWIGSVKLNGGHDVKSTYLNNGSGWVLSDALEFPAIVFQETLDGYISNGEYLIRRDSVGFWVRLDQLDGEGLAVFLVDNETSYTANTLINAPFVTTTEFNQSVRTLKTGVNIDVNNNGRANWVSYLRHGNLVGFNVHKIKPGWTVEPEYSVDPTPYGDLGEFVDINSDGLLDWVLSVQKADGSIVQRTLINVGNGVGWQEAASDVFPPLYDENGNKIAHLIDVNNDGKLDWVSGIKDADGQVVISTQNSENGGWAEMPPSQLPFEVASYDATGEYTSLGQFADIVGDDALDWLDQTYVWHETDDANVSRDSLFLAAGEWSAAPNYRLPVLNADWLSKAGEALAGLANGETVEGIAGADRNILDNVELAVAALSDPSPKPNTSSTTNVSAQIGGSGDGVLQSSQLIDVDGDGRLDWLKSVRFAQGAEQKVVWLRTDDGWEPSSTFVPPYILHDFTKPTLAQVVDINSDGLPDFIASYTKAGVDKNEVWLNDGASWVQSSDINLPATLLTVDTNGAVKLNALLVDINADGLLDFVSDGLKGSSYLNANGSWLPASDLNLPTPFVKTVNGIDLANGSLRDVNGDGLVDWLAADSSGDVVYLNTSGAWVESPEYKLKTSLLDDKGRPKALFADLNADGLPDLALAYKTEDGSEQRNTWLNTGSGWRQSNGRLLPNTVFFANQGRGATLADFNGDGRLDFLQSVKVGDIVSQTFWLGTAKGWVENPAGSQLPVLMATATETKTFDYSFVLSDADGDHQLDFLPATKAQADQSIRFGVKSTPGLLVTLSDGTKRSEIAFEKGYKPFTVYNDSVIPTYPLKPSNGPSVVVAGYQSFASTSLNTQERDNLISDVSYTYGDYAVDLQRQQSASFKWSKSVDWVGERVTRSEFRQDFPFIGRPNVIDADVLYGNVLSKTLYSYDALLDDGSKWSARQSFASELVADTKFKHITPYADKSVARSHKLNGELLNEVETDFIPDEYGQTEVSVARLKEAGDVHTTTTTYVPDANVSNWQLNKFSSVTVHKTNSIEGAIAKTSVTTRRYNAKSQLESETTAGLTSSYTYDVFGNPSSSTQSGGSPNITRTQTNDYDSKGRYLVETINPVGEINRFEYQAIADSPTKITVNNGGWSSYQFDGFGRETREEGSNKVKRPRIIRFCNAIEGETQVRACPSNARYLTAQLNNESQGSAPETVYYDLLGREIRRVTANAETLIQIDTEYYLNGKVKQRTVPYAPSSDEELMWIGFTYDAFGRATYSQQPNGSAKSWEYDGRQVIEYDEFNVPTTTVKTHFGAPAEVIDAYGEPTQYKYDVFGQLISTIDAKGNETTITYDALGNKEVITDPDHGVTTFDHDVFGNVLSKTDSLGNSEIYEYDQFGRRETRTDRGKGSDGNTLTPVVTHWRYYSLEESKAAYAAYIEELTESEATEEYIESLNEIAFLNPDAASNLVKEVSNSEGYTQALSYDYRMRPVEEEVTVPGGETRTMSTTYAGETTLPATIRYPNNFSVRYNYDETGYLTSVKNGGLNTVDHYSKLIEHAVHLSEKVGPALWERAEKERGVLEGVKDAPTKAEREGLEADYRRLIRSANAYRDGAFTLATKATNSSHDANDARMAVEFLKSELLKITSADSQDGRNTVINSLFGKYAGYWTNFGSCPSIPKVYTINLPEYSVQVASDDPNEPAYITRGGKPVDFELPWVCTDSHVSGYKHLKKSHHKTERRLVDQLIGMMTKLRERSRGADALAQNFSEQSVVESNKARDGYIRANRYYNEVMLPQILYASRIMQSGNEVIALANDVFSKAARVYQFHEIEREITYWTANESDEVNRITSETFGNGVTSTREYDQKSGRLRAIRTVAPRLEQASIDTNGIIVNSETGASGYTSVGTGVNPIIDTYELPADPANDQYYQSERYTYDVRGNLRGRFNGALGTNDSFTYDRLNRLKEANYAFLDNGQTVTQSFDYDSIGNIVSKSDIGEYEYHPTIQPHAVKKAGNRVYEYDDAGRMVVGDGSTFAYTTFSKPSLITDDNGTSVEYRYGPQRARYYQKRVANDDITENYYFFKGLYEESIVNGAVEKNVSITAAGKTIAVIKDFSNTFITPQELEIQSANDVVELVAVNARTEATLSNVVNLADIYQFDRYDLIANTSQDDTVKESEAGSCVEREEDDETDDPTLRCLTDEQTEEVKEIFAHQLININYFHYDNLDSVKVITNNVGELVGINHFDAFGSPILRPEEDVDAGVDDSESGEGFGGHEAIVGTELVHMNGRIYDPTIGRFLSADPFVPAFGDGQALNRYSYVYNNPLRYVDPSGYKPVSASQHERNEYIFVSLAYFELEITLPSNAHLYDLLALSRNDRATFEKHIVAWGASPEAFDRATSFIEGGQRSAQTAIEIRKAKREAKYLVIVQVVVTIFTAGAGSGVWYLTPLINTAAQFAITGELDLQSVALNFAGAFVGAQAGAGGLGDVLKTSGLTGFQQAVITQLATATVRGFASHLSGGEFEHGFAAGIIQFELQGLFPDLSSPFARIARSGLIEGIVTEIANDTRNGEKLDFLDGFQVGALRQAASEAITPLLGGEFRDTCKNMNGVCNFSSIGNVVNLLIEDGDKHSLINAIAGAVGNILSLNNNYNDWKDSLTGVNEQLVSLREAVNDEDGFAEFLDENGNITILEEDRLRALEKNERIDTEIRRVAELNGGGSLTNLPPEDKAALFSFIEGEFNDFGYALRLNPDTSMFEVVANFIVAVDSRNAADTEKRRAQIEKSMNAHLMLQGLAFNASHLNIDFSQVVMQTNLAHVQIRAQRVLDGIVTSIEYENQVLARLEGFEARAAELADIVEVHIDTSGIDTSDSLSEAESVLTSMGVLVEGSALYNEVMSAGVFDSNSSRRQVSIYGNPYTGGISYDPQPNPEIQRLIGEGFDILNTKVDGLAFYKDHLNYNADGYAATAVQAEIDGEPGLVVSIYYIHGAGIAIAAAFIPDTRLEAGLTIGGVFGKAVGRLRGFFNNADDVVPPRNPGRVDAEAGISRGSVGGIENATPHERLLATELADNGQDVIVRGTNIPGATNAPGPDLIINGKFWEVKQITPSSTSKNAISNRLGEVKKQFDNEWSRSAGLSRADSRVIFDVRGNSTWDSRDKIYSELYNRLARNGKLDGVQDIRIITSNGTVTWRPKI